MMDELPFGLQRFNTNALEKLSVITFPHGLLVTNFARQIEIILIKFPKKLYINSYIDTLIKSLLEE